MQKIGDGLIFFFFSKGFGLADIRPSGRNLVEKAEIKAWIFASMLILEPQSKS